MKQVNRKKKKNDYDMSERMQKTKAEAKDCPQRERTESEEYAGVQTYMEIFGGELVEMHFKGECLMEQILDMHNLHTAYRRVVGNGGSSGVDGMAVGELVPWGKDNIEDLRHSLLSGTYVPQPVRRVEIPKDNGKKRLLGIPTVIDRMVQQAICQVLGRIYEPTFSRMSYGFRPRRGAHQALAEARRNVTEGYRYAVGIDLERFFDTVNQSKLIDILSRKVKDGRVVSLIHKYLRSGVMVNGVLQETEEGTPQGGPLSPLLSNIMLNELDKELERRRHRFVRYADDSLIFCRSKRAAQRVCKSVTRFIEEELLLKVNREKTEVGYVGGMKYLGYSFYVSQGQGQLCVHPKTYDKLKQKLKTATMRSNGIGFQLRKERMHQIIRGWICYFRLANMQERLKEIDEWLRRRYRMCIWKAWKRCRTKVSNLIKCGISQDLAIQWGTTSKKYWRVAKSPILHKAIGNEALRRQGWPCLMDYYNMVVRVQ